MFQFNKLEICLLLILMINTGNILIAEDHGGPYRPYSEDLKFYEIDLTGLDEAAYAAMTQDDIRLKNAYIEVFSSALGGIFRSKRPEIVGALADMRKRGAAVTPMLLKLMNENQETGFELMVLNSVDAVETIPLEPYLDYARDVLKKRTMSMSAVLAGSASNLLAKYGTKEDAELMKWVMETRPWLADSVTRKRDELNRRLELTKQETLRTVEVSSLTSDIKNGDSGSMVQKSTTETAENEREATPWVPWALAILVAGGLLLLVLIKRKH